MANPVTTFLRALAGGSSDLEDDGVNPATRLLYTGKGLLLFGVSAASAAIAANTWGSVFHDYIVGAFAGALWFIASLALNLIISWKLDQARIQGSSKSAALLIACTLGFVVASVNTSFILMKVYDAEIRGIIQAKYQDERAAIEQKLVAAKSVHDEAGAKLRSKATTDTAAARAQEVAGVAKLQAEFDRLRGDYQAKLTAITTEVDGRGPSRQIGEGARARTKKAEAEETKGLLAAAETQLANEKVRLASVTATRVAQIDSDLRADLIAFDKTLEEVQSQGTTLERSAPRCAMSAGPAASFCLHAVVVGVSLASRSTLGLLDFIFRLIIERII
jgi:hypothetical protein